MGQVVWEKTFLTAELIPGGETQREETGHVWQPGQVFTPLRAPCMASFLQDMGGEGRVPAWAPCSPARPAAEAVNGLVAALKITQEEGKSILTVCSSNPIFQFVFTVSPLRRAAILPTEPLRPARL